jgi:hypothetical protein
VRAIIKTMSTRELPGITPFRIHEHFINKSVKDWKDICLDAFSQVENILKSVAEGLCKKHFERFRSFGLLNNAKYIPIL